MYSSFCYYLQCWNKIRRILLNLPMNLFKVENYPIPPYRVGLNEIPLSYSRLFRVIKKIINLGIIYVRDSKSLKQKLFPMKMNSDTACKIYSNYMKIDALKKKRLSKISFYRIIPFWLFLCILVMSISQWNVKIMLNLCNLK